MVLVEALGLVGMMVVEGERVVVDRIGVKLTSGITVEPEVVAEVEAVVRVEEVEMVAVGVVEEQCGLRLIISLSHREEMWKQLVVQEWPAGKVVVAVPVDMGEVVEVETPEVTVGMASEVRLAQLAQREQRAAPAEAVRYV